MGGWTIGAYKKTVKNIETMEFLEPLCWKNRRALPLANFLELVYDIGYFVKVIRPAS